MKLSTIRFLLLALLLAVKTNIYAEQFEVNGIRYETTSSSTVKVIEKFPDYKGDIVIPEFVDNGGNTYRITSIGDNAFYYCRGLSSVTISNSVTSIGNEAFYGCNSLTSVAIGNSVTSIGVYAFSGCSSLTSVNIPNSVTSIGSNAFAYCSSLTSVTIPNSVTSIESNAFYGCCSLTSVTIGNSVTSIGDSAFSDCNNLNSITIPSSVTYIGNRAFPYNAFMELLGEIPPELSDKGEWGAYHKIEVPKGSACRYAIAENWEKTDTISSKDGNTILYPVAIMNNKQIIAVNGNLNGVEVIEGAEVEVTNANNQYLPYSMIMRDNYEITNTIMRDGKYVFKASSNHKTNVITTYNFPHKDIQLSESGTLMDKIDIDNIDNIECLKVSGDINGTDILTIRKMKSLKLLDLSDAHIVNGGLSYYKDFTTSENAIGEGFYDGLSELLRIKLPKDIHTIKSNAFKGCKSIITIKMPSSLKFLWNNWIDDLPSLRSLELEDIKAWCEIESYYIRTYPPSLHVFFEGNEVFNLVIPKGTTKIKDYAFDCCHWLKSVTIPSSVKNIGRNAFLCNNIISVTSLNPTPPEIGYNSVFLPETEEKGTLYVPKGSKTLYWLHPYWENFKNIVELDGTSINDITIDPSPKSKGVYAIDGVKLSSNADNADNLPKGIYIINGQKVVIK